MKRTCECCFRVDPDSDKAIYLQLRDHIVSGIARGKLREGDCLPSVRQLAEQLGVNMHTVNKAYALLAQEGFVSVVKCKGVLIVIDADRDRAVASLKEKLRVTLAEAVCRNLTKEEVCLLVEDYYNSLSGF